MGRRRIPDRREQKPRPRCARRRRRGVRCPSNRLMNLLDALQPLRRKLPLLITSLLLVVVAAASWSAYHHLERALILAASDRAGGAAQRLAALVDDQMTRARLDEQRVAALPWVVRFAVSRRPADREEARVDLDRERAAGAL